MRTLIKAAGSLLAGLLLLGAIAIFAMSRPRDLTSYQAYREPQLVNLPAQQVLVLERSGDPNQIIPELLSIYYQLPEVEHGAPPPPRSRPGLYALPVSPSVTSAPAPARLETWTYGDVAQLLYEGPRARQQQAIDTLEAFIGSKGYRASGPREDEYLRGAGLFGSGDSEHALTLIRYPVEKKEAKPSASQM
ncbi:MAG: hypothetical protein QM723_30520 [Myxococcaceae bacterium]